MPNLVEHQVTVADSAITAAQIADGSIVNAEIASNASIAVSKLAAGVSAQALIADANGVPTFTTISGDITISPTGEASVTANAVALGTDTTGNYIATITGTANEITVTGSGSESATVTLSLPANVTISNNLTVTGDLTISGNTTTLNTANLNVEDNFILLNSGVTGNPALNAGLEVERGDSANVAIRWNESDDRWQITNDGNTYANVSTTTELSNHESDTTNIHGIADTSILVTTTGTQTLTNKTLTSPYITGVSPVITLGGDLDGSVTLTDLGSGTLTATIKANSVALGTDTTGNYVSDISAGSGISVTHTPAEGSTATIGLNANLDALSDVVITSPSTDQFLRYNGSSFVNATVALVTNLDSVTDVVITSAVTNQVLVYDGTNWVNTSNPTVAGNVTITGNLTVSGTTTTVNSETLTINDNIIVLNNNEDGSPSENAGIEIERGTSTNVVFRWNETNDFWEFTNDGSKYERIVGDTVTNAQSAAYTLVLADRAKLVEMNVASGNNLTVPTNANVAFPVGTTITVLQTGTGQTTLAGQGGVTVNATPGLKLRAQWSSATLIKRATDTWVAIGDLSA
jgi:hypothetical protein